MTFLFIPDSNAFHPGSQRPLYPLFLPLSQSQPKLVLCEKVIFATQKNTFPKV